MKPSKSTRLSAIWTLVLFQLRGSFSLSFKYRKKETLTKLVLYLFGIAAMTVLMYGLVMLLGYLHVFGTAFYLPVPLWNIVFYLYLILSFGSTLLKLNDALFTNKDNSVFLSFPLKVQDIFLAKIIFFALQKLIQNLFFLLPMLISLGINYGLVWGYYPWAVLMMVVLSLLSVALSSLLAIPVYYIRAFLKARPTLTSLLSLGVLVGATILVFYIVGLIPENLAIAQKWLTIYLPAIIKFAQTIGLWLYPLALISMTTIGYIPWSENLQAPPQPFTQFPLLGFIAMVLITLAALAAVYFLCGKRFAALAMKAQEHKQTKPRAKARSKNHKMPRFISRVAHEFLIGFRDYRSLSSHYLLFVVTPMAILLLNAVFASMHKSFTGQLLTVLFNGLIVALIALTTNVSVSSIYSQEGQAGLVTKTFPEDLLFSFLSRLIVRATIMTASLVFTMFVYSQHQLVNYLSIIPFFFSIEFLYLGHLLWSAELDYLHPKTSLYETIESNVSLNKNELLSSIFALLLSVVYGGLLFFFVNESTMTGIYHLLAFCTVFFIGRSILFVRNVRAYQLLPYERGDRR